MKTETMITMPLPDQDPMVQASILSQRLGLAYADEETTSTFLHPQ